MGYYLLLLMLPALCVTVLAKWVFHHTITLKEWGVQFLANLGVTALLCGFLALAMHAKTGDTEIWNGYVLDKYSEKVSCEHQYQCGQTCSTDSKGNQTCVPIYCDEHSYDIDWTVKTTVGYFDIDRVDRRGLKEPPRFTQVSIGDFAADEKFTRNFLLIDESRFHTDETIVEKYKGRVPKYPRIYDYYKINRVVTTNGKNYDYINHYLNERLKTLGADKQVNITVVVTEFEEDFYQALYHAWEGGKKNDVVLVYGLEKDSSKVKWFKATSFADGQDNRELLARLRIETIDSALSLELVQRQTDLIAKEFHRLPNETFKYMVESIEIPMSVLITLMIVNLLASIGAAYYVHKEDLFNEQRTYRWS
ncbi:hypothetical protein P13BB106kb_p061 [Pectobacterium phage DU_PP_V]|uniref:Transmembrane protein n=1 Tax=Pectobacterium phage DU_PP_V TaxID=2041492 RepID=A0A2D2W6X2_9CAUD|nr:hypothetical protein HOS40_gp108 [Pectobacterium phage DU_PP_V]ATS94045.1 hypothetical protein P13BB106kb_p061 [Pectobacterium phage DU_PP_V]